MLDGLTDNFSNALSFLRGGRLTEKNITDGIREVRKALLEADVNYEVVQSFVARVKEQALGDRVLKDVRPDQQFVGVIHSELVHLMGGPDEEATALSLKREGVNVIMMCGLQGAGKTTTCGKLAKMLKAQGFPTMLVAADLQRPAAIEQLKVIGEQVNAPVYTEDPKDSSPVKVCRNAIKEAKKSGDIKVVILDTAGRLHVDDALMTELETIDNKCSPDAALLVCDAMTGQDAVNSAKAFNDALDLDGVILTKLDGDTRGGAALSVKTVTGVPIKFIGTGEGLDGIEPFRPSGMADRILGMGDIVGLVQKAQQTMDAELLAKQEKKMIDGKFTLDDFRKQMEQIGKMGPMKQIMKMIPGMPNMDKMMGDMDPEEDLKRIKGIIDAMTLKERENPDLIDRSRRNRIARGSGNEPSEVNNLLKQFKGMASMMTEMAGMGMRERMRKIQELQAGGAFEPGGEIKDTKQRSKRGPDRAQNRDIRKKKKKQAQKSRKKNRK